MDKPTISYILPTKGQPEGLKRAVKSIQDQICSDPFEIIILHDGEPPLSDWSEADNIRVLFTSERQGVPKTFKRGIEKSTGEWIVFCANDIEFDPRCISAALGYMEHNKRKFATFNGGDVLPDEGNICEHFIIHRTLIGALGGEVFDTDFNHICCDNLLWAKLKKLHQDGRCEQAIFKHYHFSKPGGAMDEVYQLGWNKEAVAADRILLKQKLAELEPTPVVPVPEPKVVRQYDPKIAVYTISKNESQFLERWRNACKDADEIILVDTGSTDDTVAKARALGITVHEIKLETWRFDVARNMALDLVPKHIDWCVSVDVDEVLLPGWREHMEKTIGRWPYANRFKYHYWWNAHHGNEPRVEFLSDKIHRRDKFKWKNPVHEVLATLPGIKEDLYLIERLTIEHHPDDSKSRGSYLPLLELSVVEEPENDRNSHYLGREYYFKGMWEKAIKELSRHLSLKSATWNEERAASARYIGHSYVKLNKIDEARKSYEDATRIDPTSRDAWLDLASFEHDQKQWQACVSALVRMFGITERKLSYISNGKPWGPFPYDIGSVAAWYAGHKDLARTWFKVCYQASPNDPRMIANAQFFDK